MSSSPRRVAFFIWILALASCSRQPEQGFRRVAVLRFENLTPDRSLDWMGRAASEAIAAEISGAPGVYALPSSAIHRFDPALGGRPVSAPGISSESAQARLAGATHLIYGEISIVRGKLRLSASEEETESRKMVRQAMAEGASATDLAAAADRLARELSPKTRPFSTRNDEALRYYALALEAQPAEAAQFYARAIAADPNFGAAYVNWVRVAGLRHDRAEFESVLNRAQARGDAIGEQDRAALAIEALNLQPDPAASIAAFSAAARLNPNDPAALGGLAAAEIALGRYPAAIEHFRSALRSAPGEVELWNSLGYALMFAGDYAGAIRSIGEYERQRPNDANALDSRGDVNYYFGKFGEAERAYLQGYAKSGNVADDELIKAAYARLMTADVAGANAIFDRFRNGKNPLDPAPAFRTAEWQFVAGHRAEAVELLTRVAGASPNAPVRAAAETQLALWTLQLGDAAAARRHAESAAKEQATPQTRLIGLLTEPPAPLAELQARAAKAFPEPQSEMLRRSAVGYSLIFARDFAAAAPVWKEIAAASGPSDHIAQTIYAWTLVAAGRADEAAGLLERFPIPQPNAVVGFRSLVYPRIFYLRGVAFEKQGKRAEAKKEFERFLALAGDGDDMFGDKQRAVLR